MSDSTNLFLSDVLSATMYLNMEDVLWEILWAFQTHVVSVPSPSREYKLGYIGQVRRYHENSKVWQRCAFLGSEHLAVVITRHLAEGIQNYATNNNFSVDVDQGNDRSYISEQ